MAHETKTVRLPASELGHHFTVDKSGKLTVNQHELSRFLHDKLLTQQHVHGPGEAAVEVEVSVSVRF